MEVAEIERRVKELGAATGLKRGKAAVTGWYQTFDLKGVITGAGKMATVESWDKIRGLLPESLKGVRILDLGCNAGMFSIYPALEGAEVVGIDGRDVFIDQAEFVKEVFEDEVGELNCKFVCANLSEYDLPSLGKFDWIFAIGILRYLGVWRCPGQSLYCPQSIAEQTRIMNILTKMTGNIIIRSNGQNFNTPDYYDEWMKCFGYVLGERVRDVTKKGILNRYSRGWGE